MEASDTTRGYVTQTGVKEGDTVGLGGVNLCSAWAILIFYKLRYIELPKFAAAPWQTPAEKPPLQNGRESLCLARGGVHVMGRAAGRSRASSPSSAGHRSARRPCATGHYRVGTRLPGAPRGLQTVLPGGQLGSGPVAGPGARGTLLGACGAGADQGLRRGGKRRQRVRGTPAATVRPAGTVAAPGGGLGLGTVVTRLGSPSRGGHKI